MVVLEEDIIQPTASNYSVISGTLEAKNGTILMTAVWMNLKLLKMPSHKAPICFTTEGESEPLKTKTEKILLKLIEFHSIFSK